MTFYDCSASELARRLARDAEGVCRHYLSSGRREGRYWLVGDTANNAGRSLFVRLFGPDSGQGAAGKWTDAATGEHGDLLDLIRACCDLRSFRDVADEARAFLNLPSPLRNADLDPSSSSTAMTASPADRSSAARRLFAMTVPITGTAAETYLRSRGIMQFTGTGALRFHPACYYRGKPGLTHALPALIAAVTDQGERITGVHRTWLAPGGAGKAQVATPRRAMGILLGYGVRFGFEAAQDAKIMAAGEGIETVLSLRMVLPGMPMIAALSVAHLGALELPGTVRRLYIAADGDGAGRAGTDQLSRRARKAGIETLLLRPMLGDFNDDLRRSGPAALRQHLIRQLAPGDAERFLT